MHEGTLVLELGLVILALAVLARIGGRLGLSPIPLYLIAGLAVGEGGIVPLVTSEPFIAGGAQLGVILLLLMLGLEYSAQELTETLRSSAPAGLVDIALNFTPGFLAGLVLGWTPLAAALLGGVTYISSSGVVAKLLRDLGWTPNRETGTVLSILVIEDLVMVLYLPLIVALLLGSGTVSLISSVGVAVGVMLLTLMVALRFGPAIGRFVFSRSDEALLLTILGITLVVAGAAERLQASAAVGAFLVGLTVSGEAAHTSKPLLTPVRDLFAAVFFFFFGLQIDPGNIPQTLWVALGLAIVTGATKFLTARFAGRQAGLGTNARKRAGAALVARGEFSIVIAELATSAGVEPDLGPLAATYVLAMAMGGPVMARLVDARLEKQRLRERDRRRAARPPGGPYGV